MINGHEVISIFEEIKNNNIVIILIRNIDQELPLRLKKGKDIDVLVKDDMVFENFLLQRGYEQIFHPHRNDIYLYGIKPFKMFVNHNNGIVFDLNYSLTCRSLNLGEWIPLDKIIQDSAWNNRRHIENGVFYYTGLDINDELVTLIVRCIFDKKKFSEGYKTRINEIFDLCNLDKIKERFYLIFFKYTPYLIENLKNKDFESIYDGYISFKEY